MTSGQWVELDRCLQCDCVDRGLVVVTAGVCVKVVAEHLHPVHCTDRKLWTHRTGSIFGVIAYVETRPSITRTGKNEYGRVEIYVCL